MDPALSAPNPGEPVSNSNTGKAKSSLGIVGWVLFFLVIIAGGVGWGVITQNNAAKLSQLRSEYEAKLVGVSQLEDESQKIKDENGQLRQKVDEQGKLLCKGTWENGQCRVAICTDNDATSRPNDVYIKGKVTYTSPVSGETNDFVDGCQEGSDNIIEHICKESREGSGVFDVRSEISACANGCFDGACKR